MIVRKIKSFIGLLKTKYINRRHIILKGKINVSGIPLFKFSKTGKIIIGDNVSFKSNNNSYHLNMHSPVKIMADKPGSLIEIGENTRINGSCIHAYKKISIGKNCLIAANCQILDCSGHDLSFPNVGNRINTTGVAKEILIEDNVWIGVNSIILPGVRIGYGSVISAGSVVTKNIPPMCLAGGYPAKVLKNYKIDNE